MSKVPVASTAARLTDPLAGAASWPAQEEAAELPPCAAGDGERLVRRRLTGEPLAWNGVEVYRGELFDPLPMVLAGRVDVVVAVVPYVMALRSSAVW